MTIMAIAQWQFVSHNIQEGGFSDTKTAQAETRPTTAPRSVRLLQEDVHHARTPVTPGAVPEEAEVTPC